MKIWTFLSLSITLTGLVFANDYTVEEIRYEKICTLIKNNNIPEDKKDELLLTVARREGTRLYYGWQHVALLRLLLESGANPNAQDSSGKSALHYVIDGYDDSDCIACIDVLVKHGADINIQDKEGLTPLMIACSSPELRLDNIEHLLSLGADGNQQDNNGKNASQHVPIAWGAYLLGEGWDSRCMGAYRLLDSYGYMVDVSGKMVLYFIFGTITELEDGDCYCSEDELRFLLNHGAEIEFECDFENKHLKWSMLDYIRSHPKYPDGKVLPRWDSIEGHRKNVEAGNYITLKRIEDILVNYKRKSTDVPKPRDKHTDAG